LSALFIYQVSQKLTQQLSSQARIATKQRYSITPTMATFTSLPTELTLQIIEHTFISSFNLDFYRIIRETCHEHGPWFESEPSLFDSNYRYTMRAMTKWQQKLGTVNLRMREETNYISKKMKRELEGNYEKLRAEQLAVGRLVCRCNDAWKLPDLMTEMHVELVQLTVERRSNLGRGEQSQASDANRNQEVIKQTK